MALTTQKNWTVTTITPSTWTPLVTQAGLISTLIISNPSGGDITVSLRLTASSAVILPNTVIPANGTVVLEARSIAIPTGDGIQCWASANGAHFIASGAA